MSIPITICYGHDKILKKHFEATPYCIRGHGGSRHRYRVMGDGGTEGVVVRGISKVDVYRSVVVIGKIGQGILRFVKRGGAGLVESIFFGIGLDGRGQGKSGRFGNRCLIQLVYRVSGRSQGSAGPVEV